MNNIFLSCDWGTSSFRLRLIDAVSTEVLSQSQSDEGCSNVYEQWQQQAKDTERTDFYQAIIEKHVKAIEKQIGYALSGTTIIASGMASSSIGLMELPYKHAPFLASGDDLHYKIIEASNTFPHAIILISGVRTAQDVMRGEETQLAGCAVSSAVKTVFVFPGTHSKHVWVEDGFAVDFKTYMTGEFFNLLATKSILSKSVANGAASISEDRENAFRQGVLAAQKESLLHTAFTVRTNDLFQRVVKEQNYWYLSGLLIGAELSALLQQPPAQAVLVSEGGLMISYQAAFDTLDYDDVQSIDVSATVIAAHARFYKRIGTSIH